jgi:glycosyltransferase involved in cell wall biosynthesis
MQDRRPLKVLLVGNYEFDGSTSMKIWADALFRELVHRGIDVELISPRPVFGRLRRSTDGSAVYGPIVKNKPVVVTCNDMHAVLGALGEVPDCPASFFGRLLQKWICHGLKTATRVACISRSTYNDASRILKEHENLCVIMDALNYPFAPLAIDEINRRLADLGEIKGPFILHVGSSLTRKNREGVLRVFAKVAEGIDLQVVFAGEALNEGLIRLARDLNVYDRVVQVVKPNVEVIEALYNGALALLFPSRFEGFGWPPIEAQACGCPVVGSEIPPLVEVLGHSAALRPLKDEAGMADEIRRLATDQNYREQMRQQGLENVRSRFETSRMMSEYVSLYREVTCQS